MQTDKQKLIELLTAFGIGFDDNGPCVLCEEGMAKVKGYTGFYSTFVFDDDGTFKELEIFE